MRADMAKVLVERPRPGSRDGSRPHKGYRKRLRKAFESGDSPPAREGMKVRTGGTRFFNEHLGPLRKYIDANVGRPWDKVYAEICERVDRGNVVQKHILTHLFEYVERHVLLVDGVPCAASGRRYGEPLAGDWWHRAAWYVCPKSGLLKRVPGTGNRNHRRRELPSPPQRVRLNETQVCLRLAGQWELVTVAPLPSLTWPGPCYDVVLKRAVYGGGGDESRARRLYGAAVYAVTRRPLSKRELRMMPVPIDSWCGRG